MPDAKIYYALEKGSKFDGLPRASTAVDEVFTVRTGKLRRYHGDSALKRVLDVPTNLKNTRDVFYVVAGYAQARRLLKRLQPDVVFIKGSSVGVPIGKACQSLDIPYFTHDSDSVASLTNRLIAKDAKYHAVGLPLSFYSRANETMRYTGIPLAPQYKFVDSKLQKQYRKRLDIPDDAHVIAVTGGSNGAARLNESFVATATALLERFPNLYILHQTGAAQSVYEKLPAQLQQRVHEVAFTDELVAFTGAADIVVARTGATTIAELAVQGKACVFVPAPHLTGGQQLKNAEYLDKHGAAMIVSESDAADTATFEKALRNLLESPETRQKLAEGIGKIAKPDAAEELTAIIKEIAQNQKLSHVQKKEKY